MSIFNEQTRRDGFCDTPTAQLIFKAASWCYERGQLGLVVGDPGIGKTTALRQFSRTTPAAVMITMSPARRSMSAALGHLCNELGECAPARIADISFGLISALRARRIRLLILDEAQHLSDLVIDALRCISDETGVAILFCGNALFRSRFNNERSAFGQVTSRVGTHLALGRPKEGDVAAICNSREVFEPKARAFLFEHSQTVGALRHVGNLIDAGLRIAGAPSSLRVEHLKDALISLGGGQ